MTLPNKEHHTTHHATSHFLDSSPDAHGLHLSTGELDKITKAFVLVEAIGGDEQLVADLCGCSIAKVQTAIAKHGDTLAAAYAKFDIHGKATLVRAYRLRDVLVRRIASEAETMSAIEAVEYLKTVNRVVEAGERMALAERETDKYANLPVIHVHIGVGGQITAKPQLPVVEVEAVSPSLLAEGSAAAPTTAQLLSLGIEPLEIGQ